MATLTNFHTCVGVFRKSRGMDMNGGLFTMYAAASSLRVSSDVWLIGSAILIVLF